MQTIWFRFSLLAATAFVLAGCATADPTKAPKHPEELTVPPVEEARYSQPPNFPKDALNQDRTPSFGDAAQARAAKNGMNKGGGPSGFGSSGVRPY